MVTCLLQILCETAKASDEFWNVHFERLLMTLLDAACDEDVNALKVLLRVVMAGGARAEPFFDVLVERLLAACGGHSDVVRRVSTHTHLDIGASVVASDALVL